VLGPLVARRGKAVVAWPGGCRIGPRPVDLHLRGLAALGARLRLGRREVMASARRLRGARIDLTGPRGSTVTGTINVMSAATLARGETVITGAACEPEVVDVGRFLMALGARIDGLGTSLLRVRGVEQLHGAARHQIIPDRIEAGTLLLAGAATSGDVTVDGIRPEHLTALLETLADAGADVNCGQDWARVQVPRRLRGVRTIAAAYPGLPTDLQAPWTAVLATAEGASTVADRVFPERFTHAASLRRFGARVTVGQSVARIRGVERLAAARVRAGDLRAAAALVLAALSAEGQSVLGGLSHLDRGYQRLEDKLRCLGAQIHRDRLPPRVWQPIARPSRLVG
jgi:UDP-N-acetylglucosamine 1-carboxyvinyltransferase